MPARPGWVCWVPAAGQGRQASQRPLDTPRPPLQTLLRCPKRTLLGQMTRVSGRGDDANAGQWSSAVGRDGASCPRATLARSSGGGSRTGARRTAPWVALAARPSPPEFFLRKRDSSSAPPPARSAASDGPLHTAARIAAACDCACGRTWWGNWIQGLRWYSMQTLRTAATLASPVIYQHHCPRHTTLLCQAQ